MKRIQDLFDEFRGIKNHKLIAALFSLVAFLSFGYAIISPTIGMDDTDISAYFEKGLAPSVGRWTIFLLNKFFHVAEYTPYLMDVIGVILLIIATITFVILFNRVSNGKISTLAILAFGCVFLSSPFMGEVFIYYLHNGIGFSFLMVALTVMCIHKAISGQRKALLIPACIYLSLAIGCYESFALVYILTVCFIFFLEELYIEKKASSSKELTDKFWVKVVAYIIPLFISMIVRKIAYTIINLILGIETNARSLSVMEGWTAKHPVEIVKDLLFKFILRYFVAGRFFFGVKIFVILLAVFVITIIALAIIHKNWKIAGLGVCMIIIPWMLIPIELVITPYRASQALILLISLMALVFFNVCFALSNKSGKCKETLLLVISFVLSIIVFNQAFSLNRYFYMDHLKYENDKTVCQNIGQDLYSGFDIKKPVAFVGEYMMPDAIRDYCYVSLDSKDYEKLSKTLNFSLRLGFYEYVDNDYGYRIYEIGSQDPLAWMRWAVLDEASKEKEIYKYMRTLGYSLNQASDEQIERAQKMVANSSEYPLAGYITETDDMIIVKLGK